MAFSGSSATALLAADLSGSLSYFIATEVMAILEPSFLLSEVVVLALLCTMALTSIETLVVQMRDKHKPGSPTFAFFAVVRDTVHTFLVVTSVVTVQIAVVLVRSSLSLPLSRLLSILSTLLLTQVLTASAIVQQRVPAPALAKGA